MQTKLFILMAQTNPTVGAIESNAQHIIQIIKDNQTKHDIIVFPELALTGYPPEDFLFRNEFHQLVNYYLTEIQAVVTDCHVLIGHPTFKERHCYNSLSLIHQGKVLKNYDKQCLPNYGVFDERRYFKQGVKNPLIFELKHNKIGVCICEDIWQSGPVEDLIHQGVSTIIALNASPFDYTKYALRENLIKNYARSGVGFIYVNQIGGQDELVFDGQSFAMDKSGTICARAPAFEENCCTVELDKHQLKGIVTPLLSKEALIYKALVCGLHDYVQKNHFPGVLLGLSGGIDSALTLAIAVDALGAAHVHALMMPSRYSAQMSHDDARIQLETLNVSSDTLSIEPAFQTLLSTLELSFKGLPEDITEENLQARIRGILLMALSNKTGKMVLTTSNKSETAVGYATLYGDMCGGFSVLKDVLKTEVYALAHYRNSLSEVIPTRVLTRAPSAELRANQTDQDSLPDYAVLDAIITDYMQNNLSAEEIIQRGFNEVDVNRVIQLIGRNEYKRRQAAPGVKISPMAFGKDWRYPLTKG
jgi:NAD+ synthase (glutamine-hydrolysing)